MVCRDVQQYPQAETVKGVLILRVQGPLCFANAEHLQETMAEHEVHNSPESPALGKTDHLRCTSMATRYMMPASASGLPNWRLCLLLPAIMLPSTASLQLQSRSAHQAAPNCCRLRRQQTVRLCISFC